MTDIVTAARDLVQVVDGADWELARVQAAQDTLYAALDAGAGDPAEAFAVLLDRVVRSHVDDADGVAHVAITAGALVEAGSSARALGDAVLPKLVPVLRAARRYGDWCLSQLPPRTDVLDEDDRAESMIEAALHVDERPIPRDVFRAGMAADRPGATSLYWLRKWVLPTVAALTRDRVVLERAVADPELVVATHAVAGAGAHSLDILLGVELDRTWLVLCPLQNRAFRVVVDGVADNFTLHVLLADALGRYGIPTADNPPELFDYVRGTVEECPRNHIVGSFTMYDYRAAGSTVAEPMGIDREYWVWGEGHPRDVPYFEGMRTLVLGPPWAKAILGSERTFWSLPTDVRVVEELTVDQTRSLLARATVGARP
ncbi:hypothetical protein ACFVMC_30425 [Nocardia sp. NPDC127579]|uniref:hypothetical protein n=1 Tax=Nocardia sp. NPDC127579 TaxID=3345402 RepID=UPI00362CC597